MATTMANHEKEIEQCIIRRKDMQACKTAFIDARTPGSDKKENFCLIGGGVAENPDQIVHIDTPHGFNIGAAKQPNGCKNSHHSHDTEEVFMVHSGEWKFTWGENGTDGSVILSPGDVISLPVNMFRGFENVGQDDAMLYAILGLNDDGTAGRVTWAPYVFDNAKEHGLVLLEDGRLIDTAAGQQVPEDASQVIPTTLEEAAKIDTYSVDEMIANVYRKDTVTGEIKGGLNVHPGVREIPLIGSANPNEDLEDAYINRHHRFHLRLLQLESDAQVPTHQRFEEEVIIVQSGEVSIDIDSYCTVLHKGDLVTVPVNAKRSLKNNGQEPSELFFVRRGNYPKAPNYM